MYRPVQANQDTSVKAVFFSDKNYNTLQTVLLQDIEQRNEIVLNDQQQDRLSKTLNHYMPQVYQKNGDKPIQVLNRDVLTACTKDFSQYLQRKEINKNTVSVKTVMDDGLFQDTSQRYQRITEERNEVKALPPPVPDFRISLSEDSPPPAEMFERAKKQREFEALRASQQNSELIKAETSLQNRNYADNSFRTLQESQNRNTEMALVQRQQGMMQPRPTENKDLSLAIMPDRRDLLLAPVGSFDTMTGSPPPRDLGQANSNMTIVQPLLASPMKNDLQQNNIIREDRVVSYREVENNLFIYSADRDWLRNNKENRYSFTVIFDPDNNGQSFGPSLAAQQKFKNIVRIELVKLIAPGESLDVTVDKSVSGSITNYQDNILNFPYITVTVSELENNSYGTDNFLDRSFGVLQYDAQWISDITNQSSSTKGFLAMIPKFLKCQKEYYPTPLSTLQKMTINIRRPNGELVSPAPDTFDIGGIIAPYVVGGNVAAGTGSIFPFNINLTGSIYANFESITNNPYNFFINTTSYFSRFQICKGDRIQISGYTYSNAVLNDPTYGPQLRDFCNWVNDPAGHIVVGTGYTASTTSTTISTCNPNVTPPTNVNDVGYANFIIIQARYNDPTTGSTGLLPFGSAGSIASVLNNFGVALQSPCRLIDLNKQLNLVFRIITRDMDSLPQIRPDNNY